MIGTWHLPAAIFFLTIIVLLGIEPLIGGTVRPQAHPKWKPPTIQAKAVASVFFGAIAGWIILSHSYPAGDKNWAYTTVGTILGFWLQVPSK
jgi:predicted small integral membrane protein